MMILTKIVVGEQEEAFKDFTTIYSENAIMDSLDMFKNQLYFSDWFEIWRGI